jgi:hypothetical protein
MKRYRSPKCKPGQLLLYYGKAPGDSTPDICVAWGGAGADKPDSRLIMSAFTSERLELVYGEEREKIGYPYKWVHSLAKELEARGYDITTLRFSIEQKRPTFQPMALY